MIKTGVKPLVLVGLSTVLLACNSNRNEEELATSPDVGGFIADSGMSAQVVSSIFDSELFLNYWAFTLVVSFLQVQADLQLSDEARDALLPKDADFYEVHGSTRAKRLAALPSTAQKRLLGLCFHFFPVESLYSEKVQDYLKLTDEQRSRIEQLVVSMPTRDEELNRQMLSERRSVAWWHESRDDMYAEVEEECMKILNAEQRKQFIAAKVSSIQIPESDYFLSPLFNMDEFSAFRRGPD